MLHLSSHQRSNMSKAERHDDNKVPGIKDEPNASGIKSLKDVTQEDLAEDDEEPEQDDEEAVDDLQAKIDAIQKCIGEVYDPDIEPLPDVPAYRPAFRRVEALCEMVFEQASVVLEQSSFSDEYTRRLLHSIKDLQTPQYPEAKKIAFQGDSGVGMFMNSLPKAYAEHSPK